jgi:hypothetical protein
MTIEFLLKHGSPRLLCEQIAMLYRAAAEDGAELEQTHVVSDEDKEKFRQCLKTAEALDEIAERLTHVSLFELPDESDSPKLRTRGRTTASLYHSGII